MWKHCSSMHLGVEQTFTIKLLKKHKSAFERQVHESVLITFGKVDFILDSKREWSGESLPRLTLEVQDKVEQVDHDGTKLEPVIVGHKRTNNQATATNQVTTSCAKRSRVGEPGNMGDGKKYVGLNNHAPMIPKPKVEKFEPVEPAPEPGPEQSRDMPPGPEVESVNEAVSEQS